jgi:hypothetical protein
MAGFVIDIVLVFLFKSLVRAFQFIESLRWDHRTASVLNCLVLDPLMGCPSVRVHYKIASNGCSQEGCNEIPFCFRSSAKQHAQRFPSNLQVTVRVNPNNPEEMQFFDFDQK